MKTKSKTIAYIVNSIAAAVLLVTAQISMAGSATWLLSPQNSAWENQQLDARRAAQWAILYRDLRSVLPDKREHLHGDRARRKQHDGSRARGSVRFGSLSAGNNLLSLISAQGATIRLPSRNSLTILVKF